MRPARAPIVFPISHGRMWLFFFWIGKYYFLRSASFNRQPQPLWWKLPKSIWPGKFTVTVHSDSGPQFSSQEFQAFDKEWEFEHTMSSPYNSRSNGRAESPLKIAKRLFKRSADPYMALLEWRNTPTIDMGSTPSQRLFSRRTWW